jgi:hypothetical protein
MTIDEAREALYERVEWRPANTPEYQLTTYLGYITDIEDVEKDGLVWVLFDDHDAAGEERASIEDLHVWKTHSQWVAENALSKITAHRGGIKWEYMGRDPDAPMRADGAY